MSLDADLQKLIAGQMARGELILFTGSGFSAAAVNETGGLLPTGAQLRKEIWPLVFPDEPFDQSSVLADIYEVGIRRSQRLLGEALRKLLKVDRSRIPDLYQTWFSVPWRAIYTLNVDDLDEAANQRFPLPVPIRSISALSDDTGSLGAVVGAVHLNGRIDDFPTLTFSAQQYGERTAFPDSWYQRLVAELSAYPVLFVGTEVDEPPLWQQVAIRELRTRRSREHRPRSYLVSPKLSVSRQAVLGELNIEWIPMDAQGFAENVLVLFREEARQGHSVLAGVRGRSLPGTAIRPVADLQSETRTDLAEYLLGREPSWADVTSGYAVARAFERDLLDRISRENPQIVLVTGTAGTGKTTTLLRLATTLQVAGKDVSWLDVQTESPLHHLRQALRDRPPSILAIDDVDIFGRGAPAFLRELAADLPGLMILIAVRSSRADRLDFHRHLQSVRVLEIDVPNLEDEDIDAILDSLTKANRLGVLRGKSRPEQERIFRSKADRQLLVAMIEATTDLRFEEKVHSECRDLDPSQQLPYAAVALSTRFRHPLPREEFLIAVGGDRDVALNALGSLVAKHLVVTEKTGDLRVRHRVVAEQACVFFQQAGHFAGAVEGLLFAIAAKLGPGHSTSSREHRLLVQLMNHKFMLDELKNVGRAREIYDALEQVLSWDYHYWLQRGSLEVEIGNVRGAENFLGQAKGLAPDDYLVQTEWAYMMLKRAAQDAEAGLPHARDRADQAFADLREAISQRGSFDPYPYHVLGSQGLSWVRRARLSSVEKTAKLRELLDTVRQGRRHHPGARELELLERDLNADYLRSAVI